MSRFILCGELIRGRINLTRDVTIQFTPLCLSFSSLPLSAPTLNHYFLGIYFLHFFSFPCMISLIKVFFLVINHEVMPSFFN